MMKLNKMFSNTGLDAFFMITLVIGLVIFLSNLVITMNSVNSIEWVKVFIQ